jgi:hypothetical protein
MESIGSGGVELLIYKVLTEPDREMRASPRRALRGASVEPYAESWQSFVQSFGPLAELRAVL